MIEAMADLNNKTTSFSLESDWRELSYYTSRVMDMTMSSQGSAGGSSDLLSMAGAMAEGPWTLLQNANFSQMGVAVGMVMNRMVNLTEDDMNK